MRSHTGGFDVKIPGKYLGTRIVHSVASEGGALLIDVYYYDNIIVRNMESRIDSTRQAMLYCNGYHSESVRNFINEALKQFGYSARVELTPDTNKWVVNGVRFQEGMSVSG